MSAIVDGAGDFRDVRLGIADFDLRNGLIEDPPARRFLDEPRAITSLQAVSAQ